MKLGNLVLNFDLTGEDLVIIKNMTSNRYDRAQAKCQVGWQSIPSRDVRDFGKDNTKIKSSPTELLWTSGANLRNSIFQN